MMLSRNWDWAVAVAAVFARWNRGGRGREGGERGGGEVWLGVEMRSMGFELWRRTCREQGGEGKLVASLTS
jgi:hypothetical protein